MEKVGYTDSDSSDGSDDELDLAVQSAGGELRGARERGRQSAEGLRVHKIQRGRGKRVVCTLSKVHTIHGSVGG